MMAAKSKYLNEIELDFGYIISEDKGTYTLRSETPFPEYEEIDSPEELRPTQEIAAGLRSIDWSFTKDDTGFLTHDLHP